MRAANQHRRRDFERALANVQPDDEVTLVDLTALWGGTKANFSNVRAQITTMFGWPAPREGDRGTLFWPAKESYEQVLRYLSRNDEAAAQRAAKINALLGRDQDSDASVLPVSELAQLSRVRAEIEERERQQGAYAPLADIAATAARVFGLMSSTLGTLEMQADPNGKWPTDVRKAVHKAGTDLLLRIHAEMKDMLSGNVASGHSPSKRSRATGGRSRKTQKGRARR